MAARSFYGANRRVSNRALKEDSEVRLGDPTYRDGLAALVRDDPEGGPTAG